MAGMIVGQFVSADLDLSGATAFLDLHTKSGRDYALKRFERPIDTAQGLQMIQSPIVEIRKQIRKDKVLETNILAALKGISDGETAVNEIINVDDIDKRILETVEQVYWKPGIMGSFLNSWGKLIEFIIFWKTLFSPGFAILTPFLVVILPFFLLRNMFNMNIPVDEYLNILQRIVLNNTPNMPFGDAGSPITMIAKYGYIIMSFGVFISNIWTQVQAAIHLRAVADDLRKNGAAIIGYIRSCRALAVLLKDAEGIATADSIGFDEDTFSLGAYGHMYNDSRALARLRDWVSEYDLRIALARLKGICFPQALVNDGKFNIDLKDLYHPGVPEGRRIMNSVKMGGGEKTHMLVTGPNRGGKSTICKSVGFAVMCAQSWGIAWAKSMTFTPVSRFETALAPADTLGRLSLFEAEIEFAKHIIAISEKATASKEDSPVLVIMDEIFHSTNAHDGAEASHIFLKQFYQKGGANVGSMISTHYRELPTRLNTEADCFCMDAEVIETDKLRYTYRLIPGISNISSVREILKERGLLRIENSSLTSNEHP